MNEQNSVACIDAVITGAPIITSDISRSSYYAVAPEMLVSSDPKTVLAIPLKVEGELVGVMEMLMNSDRAYADANNRFSPSLPTSWPSDQPQRADRRVAREER